MNSEIKCEKIYAGCINIKKKGFQMDPFLLGGGGGEFPPP